MTLLHGDRVIKRNYWSSWMFWNEDFWAVTHTGVNHAKWLHFKLWKHLKMKHNRTGHPHTHTGTISTTDRQEGVHRPIILDYWSMHGDKHNLSYDASVFVGFFTTGKTDIFNQPLLWTQVSSYLWSKTVTVSSNCCLWKGFTSNQALILWCRSRETISNSWTYVCWCGSNLL